MPSTDDLKEISDVRDQVEERLYRRIEHTGRLGRLLYSLIGGSVMCVVSFTWWVAELDNQVKASNRYIEEQKRDRLNERLHDLEKLDERQERQIDYLDEKVFGYKP